jgi:ribosomal protein S18 acetylase RimI-like enzyme
MITGKNAGNACIIGIIKKDVFDLTGHTEYMFLPASSLDQEQLVATARLVYQALPQFYDLLQLDEKLLIRLLVFLLQAERSDLSDTAYALVCKTPEKTVIGAYASFSAAEISTRQTFGLLSTLEFLSDSVSPEKIAAIKQFSKGVSTAIPSESYYLSRFSVSEDYRGKGIAALLMSHFLEQGQAYSTYSLHVNRHNQRAIRFYAKNRFSLLPVENMDIQYPVMQR